MRKLFKPVSIMLCVSMLLASPAQVYAEKTASDFKGELEEKQEEIDKNKQEIEASESKIDSLEDNVADLNGQKKELQKAKNELSDAVEELDQELSNIQEILIKLEEDIEKKEKQIEDTRNELREAEVAQDEQYKSMKRRIKFMYEKGDTAYISMLFAAQSLSEMLNKAEYIEEISAYDRDLLQLFTDKKYEVANLKSKLEVEQASLYETQEQAALQGVEMENVIKKKNGEIEKYQSDINSKEDAIKEYEDMIAAQNAAIAALEASILQAEREAQELQDEWERAGLSDNDIENAPSPHKPTTPVYNGPFAFPAPSYVRVSDDYGYRIHPILGVKQFHNGLDLAAPGGSPIVAAQSGTVIAAAYSSTMGNYIMLNHGGGLITIYMHASALYVSAGQTVTKGQKIAAVGTTGRSTGNHLHFSVRLNGNYVSPWNYL